MEEDEKGVITSTGKEERFFCHNVAIATGHHAKPVYPDFPGLDTFKGELKIKFLQRIPAIEEIYVVATSFKINV